MLTAVLLLFAMFNHPSLIAEKHCCLLQACLQPVAAVYIKNCVSQNWAGPFTQRHIYVNHLSYNQHNSSKRPSQHWRSKYVALAYQSLSNWHTK